MKNEKTTYMGNDPESQDAVQYKKVTDWSKEPSVMDLKEDLEAARPSQQSTNLRIQEWEELRLVTGKERPKKIKGRSSIQPKLVRRQNEWRYSALSEPFLSSSKIFSLRGRTFEDMPKARKNEIVLNYQMDTQLNKVKFIDDYVHYAVDNGTAIVRVGWDRQSHIEIEEVPVFEYLDISEDADAIEALSQALKLKSENPNEYLNLPEETQAAVDYYLETNIPVLAQIIGYEEQEITVIDVNKPVLKLVAPANIYVDPSCEGILDDARFIIHSFTTSKAELEQAGVYKNLNAVMWDSNSPLATPDHNTSAPTEFQFKDTARKRVVAYEYWGYYDVDGSGKLTCILATWIGDVMIRMEESPYPDNKPPFVFTPYMPVKGELYGEADAELMGDNQRVVGATMRGMIDLMGRSANAQIGYAKGALDPLNRKRFDDGQDFEFNPVDTGEIFRQHKYPDIPVSAMEMVNLQNLDAEALTGIKSFSGGMSGNAYGDVAAGIRGMLDAAGKREMSIIRRLAKGLTDIGSKIVAMNAVFLSEEEVIRITNDEFEVIRREDLPGNYDIVVDIASTEVDNLKAQDMAFMLQTMGPSMDFGIVKLLLAEIARLKRMPDVAMAIQRFEPEPDPMEEALKQLEIQKAQKEIEKLDSEIALNMAKAKQATSQADMTDLNFIEQETGTKHERDMDKMSAQAQANQNLEVTKGIFKNTGKEGNSPNNRQIEEAIGYNELSKVLNNQNPSDNLGSKYFDPKRDPSLNPNLNL